MTAPLIPRPSGMINSRLPIDVCEHIIDACYKTRFSFSYDRLLVESYHTWSCTALVCSDWLPRTRFNLFYYVSVNSPSECNLLLRTLSSSPHLASLVIQVHVKGYKVAETHGLCTSYAKLLDPQLLKNCVHVYLDLPHRFSDFPRRFDRILFYPFRTLLTHISVELTSHNCSSIIRFLYTLPLLQHLCLISYTDVVPSDIPDHVMQMLHTRPCPFKCLTRLILRLYSRVRVAFPPLMFGSPVIYLVIDMPYDYGISDSLLNTIQSLRQLEYLEIRCSLLRRQHVMSTASEAWRIQHLLSLLHAAQTHSRLTQLTIQFYPTSRSYWNTIHDGTYYMNRDSFLNDILGCNEMKDTLQQFPTLRRFYLTIEENDISGYTQNWWRSEIQSRLHRDLHAAILEVELRPQFKSDRLWWTLAEIERGEQNTMIGKLPTVTSALHQVQ